MDPEALHFCHRCGRPCLSRGAGDLRYPPRPTHPGGRPLFSDPGAPAGRRLLGPRLRPGDLQGTLREPEAPAATLRVDRRPPSLSGRRAACLRGGEEGAVAPASASRSSPAHAPAFRARARAQPPLPSSPPPPPAQPLARLSPPQSLSHPPPAPDSRRETPARSCRTAAPRPPTRKLSHCQPRGCQGREPGSDFFVPVATGWRAKAFEDLESPSFGRS